MTNYSHQKDYSDFLGLDLRSSEITRPKGFTREDLNTSLTPQGSLTQRFGHHIRATGNGWAGMFNYKATNRLQNDVDEVLGVGGTSQQHFRQLWKLSKVTATFSNTNIATTGVSFYYDNVEGHFAFKMNRIGVNVLDYNCSGKTMSQLAAAIAALGDASLTFDSSVNSVPADYLSLKSSTFVGATSGATTFDVNVWTGVNRPSMRLEFLSADVSAANDTINLYRLYTSANNVSEKYSNPLKDDDIVQVVVSSGGAAPGGLSTGTDYYVVNATKATIQLAATSGGSPINITGVGSGRRFIAPYFNPYITFENYATCFANDPVRFKNVSSVDIRNVKYFSSGPYKHNDGASSTYRETASITKYDGQSLYAIGLPKTYLNSVAQDASGTYVDPYGIRTPTSITLNDDFYYKAQFVYYDKAGNFIPGPLSEPREGGSGGGAVSAKYKVGTSGIVDPNFDLPRRLGANSSYGVMATAGGRTNVNLTSVTDGFGNDHTLNIGDIAFFFDARQGRCIQREIVSVGVKTVLLSTKSLDTDVSSPNYDDGLTPQFLESAVITANLRIWFWRTISTTGTADPASQYYFMGEFPYASPISGYYFDEMADATPGDALLLPRYPPTPMGALPKGKFVANFNDQLLVGGDDLAPRTLYFDDIESVEGFPGTHSADLPHTLNAMKQTGEVLAAFTANKTVHIFSGDLSNLNFRVDEIANDVLCRSHESLRKIGEGVLAFETDKGPYSLSGGRNLQPLGYFRLPNGRLVSRIESFFTANYNANTSTPAYDRSTSIVIPGDRLYILFVPFEPMNGYTTRGNTPGSDSIAFVYDYGRDTWRRWSNVDYSAVCVQDNKIWATGRLRGAGPYLSLLSYTRQLQRDAGAYCYADHDEAILWKYQPFWEALGQPNFLKKFLRVKLSSHETRVASSTQMDVNSYIDYNASTQSNDDTITWASQLDLILKLVSQRCRSIMLEFTSLRYYEPPLISGYELEAAAGFRQELKE